MILELYDDDGLLDFGGKNLIFLVVSIRWIFWNKKLMILLVFPTKDFALKAYNKSD